MAAVGLTVAVAVLAAVLPGTLRVWAGRNLLLSPKPWPRAIRLEAVGFVDGAVKVASGTDFDLLVRALPGDVQPPVVPASIEVRYAVAGGARGRRTMSRLGAGSAAADSPRGEAHRVLQQYELTFHGILSPIRFDVVGGDVRLHDLEIRVVPSPTLTEIELEYIYPAYMERPNSRMPVAGAMSVPVGTRLVLRGRANKELRAVRIDAGDVDKRAVPPRQLAADELTADRRGFACALPPLTRDTTLALSLIDVDGIKSREPIPLALIAVADDPPQAAVQLVGIGSAVTPQARLPVAGRITDDYGIAKVWYEYCVEGKRPGTVPLAALARHPAEFSLSDVALEAGPLGLVPGQRLSLAVKAADLCDLGHGPNVGSSEAWVLDVVSPEELRVMLEARELVLRQRLEAVVEETSETRDLLLRMDFSIAGKAAPPAAGQNPGKPAGAEPGEAPAAAENLSAEELSLRRGDRAATAVQNCRKNAQETLGLAESIDDIRQQLANNRIDTEELKNRLGAGIAEPLRLISGEMFPELERRLEGLQAAVADLQAAPPRRDAARQQADDILLAMRQVLGRMVEMEDFNALVERLRVLVQLQHDLATRTQQQHKQRIRDLLESPGGKNDAAPGNPRSGNAAAEKLAGDQRRLADQYRDLEKVLLRLRDFSRSSDPQRAVLVEKALKESGQRRVEEQFEDIVQLLQKDQLSRAMEGQSKVEQDLKAILDLLQSENRAKHIESEKARLRKYLQRVARLIREQKDLQGRTTGRGNPKPLSEEQGQLADKARGLSNDLPTGQENKAEGPEKSPGKEDNEKNPLRNRLESARQRMEEARKRLDEAKRKDAAEEQEKAIRELERAKADLEEILRQLREEETKRILAMLEGRFRKMLQAEREVYEGTLRLDRVAVADRSHNEEIEAARLGGKQAEIVVEVDKALMVLREEGSAVALPEAVQQVRDDMQQVAHRLAGAKVDRITQAIERDVIAALEEILEAVNKAQKDADAKKKPRASRSGEPQEPPLVDTLAELKMIRALQIRVNRRTERYAKLFEGEQADKADVLDALRRLAEQQSRIYRVTRDMELGKNE
jgi:hypothetical protein